MNIEVEYTLEFKRNIRQRIKKNNKAIQYDQLLIEIYQTIGEPT